MAELEYYSGNRLTNPGAEEGDLTGWTDEGTVAVASGGYEGDYCFELGETASIEQDVTIPGQPSDYQIKGYFLPEEDPADDSVEVPAFIELIYEYGDGTFDEFRFPCRNDVYALIY